MAKRYNDLSRRPATKNPKKKFCLVCEGRNTEPEYFRSIKRRFCGTLVEVQIAGGVGTPLTIAREAVKRKKAKKGRDSLSANDEVWAVFDIDTHPNVAEAANLCQSNGIGVARSNPCFELWLILHVRDYDRPASSADLLRDLRIERPEYNPNEGKTPDCNSLVQQVATAINRAEAQLRRRDEEGNIAGVPSTTVGRLVQAILTAAEQWNTE